MRFHHAALAAVLVVSLSGCSAIADAGSGVVDMAKSKNDILMKTDISNAKVAILAYTIDSPGAFPADVGELATWGYSPTDGQAPVSFSGNAADFCVQGIAESGTTFHATVDGPVEDGPCA